MKNIFTDEREIKTTKLHHALITFAVLIVVMSVGIKVFEVDPHIPMFIGVIAAAVMAMVLGYRWADIEKMMMFTGGMERASVVRKKERDDFYHCLANYGFHKTAQKYAAVSTVDRIIEAMKPLRYDLIHKFLK